MVFRASRPSHPNKPPGFHFSLKIIAHRPARDVRLPRRTEAGYDAPIGREYSCPISDLVANFNDASPSSIAKPQAHVPAFQTLWEHVKISAFAASLPCISSVIIKVQL